MKRVEGGFGWEMIEAKGGLRGKRRQVEWSVGGLKKGVVRGERLGRGGEGRRHGSSSL